MFRNIPVKNPHPDSNRFINALMGKERVDRPPLIEYLVDDVLMRPITTDILGRQWVVGGEDRASQAAALDNFIQFWYRLGYDFVRFEQSMGFTMHTTAAEDTALASHKDRAWADQHQGMIRSWEDFESYPWPDVDQFDFFNYEYLNSHLPEGMGLIVCHAAGMFEHLSQIMSYEGLCLAVMEDPELVQAMSDKLGGLMVKFYEHLLTLDRVIAIFPGDDLGFRTATLVSPDDLRKYVFPWHKRFAAMTHEKGLPYFLHSCGNLTKVMDDLIDDVKIDGKHSYEDAIIPVEDFQARYGDRIAVLGGVDVHRLTTHTPEQIRERVRFLKDVCGSRGRYAIGSGNSIPSYIPLENYLTMVDEALN